jgi:hypothetical protein
VLLDTCWISPLPYPVRIPCVGPSGMQEADVVGVLRRCRTPLLPRRVKESDEVFKLVGSCFVLGLMDGEAKVKIGGCCDIEGRKDIKVAQSASTVTVELEMGNSGDNEGGEYIKAVDSAVEFLVE